MNDEQSNAMHNIVSTMKQGWNCKRRSAYEELLALAEVENQSLSSDEQKNADCALEIVLHYGSFADCAQAIKLHHRYTMYKELVEG